MKTVHCLAPLLSSDWRCPGCGTLAADCKNDIVLHHDHREDEFRGLAKALRQKWKGSDQNNLVQDAGFVQFVLAHRRFCPVPVCSKCNTRDGLLKQENGVHRSFSFSAEQLSSLYHGNDEVKRKASAVHAWELCEKEYYSHLAASLKAWHSAAQTYNPEKDFRFPSRELIEFKGLETIVANLTHRNSKKVCQDALKVINGTYWLTPHDALRKAFEKRRLHNAGKQKSSFVTGIKRNLG